MTFQFHSYPNTSELKPLHKMSVAGREGEEEREKETNNCGSTHIINVKTYHLIQLIYLIFLVYELFCGTYNTKQYFANATSTLFQLMIHPKRRREKLQGLSLVEADRDREM